MQLIELCQAYLDAVSVALLEGDFQRYAALFLLPLRVERAGHEQVVASRDTLHTGFAQYRAALHSQGVTDVIRQALVAERTYGDAIACIYGTHLLKRGHRIADPCRSAMLLQRDSAAWKTVGLTNSLFTTRIVSPPSRSAPGASPLATPAPPEDQT